MEQNGRVGALIDSVHEEHRREFASRLLLDPDSDVAEITARIAQKDAELARNRFDLLTRTAEIFDEVLGPEGPASQ
jgi:hypothetical protein